MLTPRRLALFSATSPGSIEAKSARHQASPERVTVETQETERSEIRSSYVAVSCALSVAALKSLVQGRIKGRMFHVTLEPRAGVVSISASADDELAHVIGGIGEAWLGDKLTAGGVALERAPLAAERPTGPCRALRPAPRSFRVSYDLMVFDPAAAPADRESFMQWFDAQTEWSEDHDYDDASVTTPALRAWFLELGASFPAMNGPHAPEDDDVEDESSLTDYSIGRSLIYGAFAWSRAEEAHELVFELAKKHRLGFFDVSADDGAVWLPDASGG